MMIFLKEKLVFFATPKTASTSIELALGPVCDMRLSRTPNVKHTPYRKYKRYLEPFVLTLTDSEPDTVAMIREPQEWLSSWYRYRARDELTGTPNSTKDISFDTFVAGYLSDEPPQYARLGSQAKFMSDKDGSLGMSHLFRYDDMDSMVTFLQNRLRKQISLSRSNTSPVMETRLSPDLRRSLETTYARDFELYEMLKRPT